MDVASLVLGIVGAVAGAVGTITGGLALWFEHDRSRVKLRLAIEARPGMETPGKCLRVTNAGSFGVLIHIVGVGRGPERLCQVSGSVFNTAGAKVAMLPFELPAGHTVYLNPFTVDVADRLILACKQDRVLFAETGTGEIAYVDADNFVKEIEAQAKRGVE